jgi:hypothetical protein
MGSSSGARAVDGLLSLKAELALIHFGEAGRRSVFVIDVLASPSRVPLRPDVNDGRMSSPEPPAPRPEERPRRSSGFRARAAIGGRPAFLVGGAARADHPSSTATTGA